jgi:hypothetical protein
MHKSHSKELTAPDVSDLRRFISKAGWSPELSSQSAVDASPVPPSLMIVVDHHKATIFHVDVTSDDASKHVIRPYDPHFRASQRRGSLSWRDWLSAIDFPIVPPIE